MSPSDVIELTRNALLTAALLAAPVLVAGLVVGLATGILQAVTQIQDHTIAFVPKLIAMIIVLTLCLPWLLQQWLDYSDEIIQNIPRVMGLG